VTNELSIRITLKYAGDELDVFTMLATANRLPHLSIEELERDLETGPSGDLPELLCQLVVQTSLPVLLAGPLQDYHADSDALSLLRDRLDLVRQTTRHFGRVDVLACRFGGVRPRRP
jgi:5-methylcytosine-specific restriction endonuclease McrBC regulatory subunit McrC